MVSLPWARSRRSAESVPEPETTEGSALEQMYQRLPGLVLETGHHEMWGVDLMNSDSSHRSPAVSIILQKFLRANDHDVNFAAKQFKDALKWRALFNPTGKLDGRVFDDKKFKGLGYVTQHRTDVSGGRVVVMWNLYGEIVNLKGTFEDTAEIINFRIALMELGLREMRLLEVPASIPEGGPDRFKIVHVHDCANVKSSKLCPLIKASIRQTMDIFQRHYPGLLEYNHFADVGFFEDLSLRAFKAMVPESWRPKFSRDIGRYKISRTRDDVWAKFEWDEVLENFHLTLPSEFGGHNGTVYDARTVRMGSSDAQGDRKPQTRPGVTPTATDRLSPDAIPTRTGGTESRAVSPTDTSANPEALASTGGT